MKGLMIRSHYNTVSLAVISDKGYNFAWVFCTISVCKQLKDTVTLFFNAEYTKRDFFPWQNQKSGFYHVLQKNCADI